MIAYDEQGNPIRLRRVGSVPRDAIDELRYRAQQLPARYEPPPPGYMMDSTGALVRVQHTLDPEAAETIRELRRGAPVLAFVGGAAVAVGLVALIYAFTRK